MIEFDKHDMQFDHPKSDPDVSNEWKEKVRKWPLGNKKPGIFRSEEEIRAELKERRQMERLNGMDLDELREEAKTNPMAAFLYEEKNSAVADL